MTFYQMIRNWFTYHPPQSDEQVVQYQQIRNAGLEFAELVANTVPDSAERHIALNKIREAVMWANAGIACAPEELSLEEP